MDLETLKYLSSMGVGGVLAGVMFFVYRKDVKGQADTMTQIVKDNTIALTSLRVFLEENLNGHGPTRP